MSLLSKYGFPLAMLCYLLTTCSCVFVDTEAPVMAEPSLNGGNGPVDATLPATLKFAAYFEDNAGLGRYRIQITPKDSNLYEGRFAPPLLRLDTPFRFGGAKNIMERELTIGTNQAASGDYLFALSFQDLSENQGQPINFDVTLTNPAPFIQLFGSLLADTARFSVADGLPIAGQVTDPTNDLASLRATVKVYQLDRRQQLVVGPAVMDTVLIADSLRSQISMALFFQPDSAGLYQLDVIATDTTNLATTLITQLEVLD